MKKTLCNSIKNGHAHTQTIHQPQGHQRMQESVAPLPGMDLAQNNFMRCGGSVKKKSK